MIKKKNKEHTYECTSCGRYKCLPHRNEASVMKWCPKCSPKNKGKKMLHQHVSMVRGQRKLTWVMS